MRNQSHRVWLLLARGGLQLKTFTLRNRLAHFKDEQTAVQGPVELDEFLRKLPDFPDHELVCELGSRCKSQANAMVAGKFLIDRIFEEYVHAEGA